MKQTAKQRIERAVENCMRTHGLPLSVMDDATKLILAERARMKRVVRKLDVYVQSENGAPVDVVKLNDILALWEG